MEGRRRKGAGEVVLPRWWEPGEKFHVTYNILNKKIVNWCRGTTEEGCKLRVT